MSQGIAAGKAGAGQLGGVPLSAPELLPLEHLDFQLTCLTRSGCGRPAVALIRTEPPCGHVYHWTLCEVHTARLYSEWNTERRWRCVEDHATVYVATFANLVKEVRSL